MGKKLRARVGSGLLAVGISWALPAHASPTIKEFYSSDECCSKRVLTDCEARASADPRCAFGAQRLSVTRNTSGACAGSPCHEDPAFQGEPDAACVPYIKGTEPELANGIDDNCDGVGLGDEFCDGIDSDNDGAVDEDAGSCAQRILFVPVCWDSFDQAGFDAAVARWQSFFTSRSAIDQCDEPSDSLGRKFIFLKGSHICPTDRSDASVIAALPDGIRRQDLDVLVTVVKGDGTGAAYPYSHLINLTTDGLTPGSDGEFTAFAHEYGHAVLGLNEEYVHRAGAVNEVVASLGCDPQTCCVYPYPTNSSLDGKLCLGNLALDLEGWSWGDPAPATFQDGRCIMSNLSAPGWNTGNSITGEGSHRGWCQACWNVWSTTGAKCSDTFAGLQRAMIVAGTADPSGKVYLTIAGVEMSRAASRPNDSSGPLVLTVKDSAGHELRTFSPRWHGGEPDQTADAPVSFWLREPVSEATTLPLTVTASLNGIPVSRVTAGGAGPTAALADVVVECQQAAGTPAVLDAGASTDPDGDTLYFEWSSTVPLDPPDAAQTTGSFGLGQTDVTVRVQDGTGAYDLATATVHVVDTTPPELTVPASSPITLCSSDVLKQQLTVPTATDACSSNSLSVLGELVSFNGKTLPSPILVDAQGALALRPGTAVVRWTATDARGLTSSKLQTLNITAEEGVSCCEATQSVSQGTSSGDVLSFSGAQSRCLLGLAGSDQILSGTGNDTLFGGADADNLQSGGGFDWLSGGGGGDAIYCSAGTVWGHGGPGDDSLQAPYCDRSELWGGAGNDHLVSGPGNDLLIPGPGVDAVSAGDGDDRVVIYDVCETEAGEILDGGSGTDVLITPVSIQALAARGVTVTGFEQVQLDASSTYLAECF